VGVDAARPGARDLTTRGSALAPWFPGPAAVERFRRRLLGRAPVVLRARETSWRTIAPDFDAALALGRAGVPFQTVIDRRYDRSGHPRGLARAIRAGGTIYFPQVHQVLPRLARLMVALRMVLTGSAREECSFLFAVEGRGREGMGVHHDGEVNAFWLQLEGRRTVTIGPAVARRAPLDLPDSVTAIGGREWRTIDLRPGTLFHLPPRTPHRVVCHGRSLAVSLTWTRARRPGVLTAWDVVDGRVDAVPHPSADRLWTQVPVMAGPVDRHRRDFPLSTTDGVAVRLPAAVREWAARLSLMPWLRRREVPAAALPPLLESGILAAVDLPRVVYPSRPRALDGWRFA
jgi:mannose-6-phosphate isomerase-like protein (cupin superfamily)